MPKAPTIAADLEAGRQVLVSAADALRTLADRLDAGFSRAVDVLMAVSGRVIVSGMGKSGHIGRKIASTLASTGTPAQFVHPGEASHGDLGMITAADAVLALSNSGESHELSDLVAYARRFSIPLIGMTTVAGSALDRASDVTLLLPPVGEACPMGLAPTTSSTMMLALGDALAVALLQRKGFTADDFRTFHPGGKLGRILVRVEDLMHGAETLPLVDAATPMSETILVMSHKGFGCIGVVDCDGLLIGIVTDGDLRRHMGPDLLSVTVASVMTPGPKVIGAQSLAADALRIMNERHITSLFVVADDHQLPGRPLGLIHVHDCLRAGIM